MSVGGRRPFDSKESRPLRCTGAYKLTKSALTGQVVQSPAIRLHGATQTCDWRAMHVATEWTAPQV